MLLGGVFHKCLFYKKNSCCERIKLRPVSSVKNTPFTFFAFFSPCLSIFFKKINLLIFGELRKLHAKIYTFSMKIHREINFWSWLLFYWIFHSCRHFAIVHWFCLLRLGNMLRVNTLFDSCIKYIPILKFRKKCIQNW